ncbi:4'-phosphopantetheinyl transferase superfamily protein [Paenibacillus sp. SC116]|uniref:4'-phosphopantetheinyl transferase family protein n=1 Tax=Paenibacillus sp. SC116 TaxID=2968986 RepID=UPI00215A820F|nr:4'-phosphopantetheinyl transferase superfamily protein [Paenibacillus sp. SC116]MCR8846045.1 4'-phosphopantetheinyl transferase superfamily protein [Paenibacillus sp. SC116]
MQEIIAVTAFADMDEKWFEQSLQLLPTDKQQKISRYMRKPDQLRALIGEITVRLNAMSRTGLSHEQLHFDTNTYGKPFLRDMPSFSYNVSHSGDWVVCAIDETEVGVDVENIQPIDLAIAERFFSKEEVNDLFALPEHERQAYFFDLWTLKESYIKAVGKGLSIPLNSFSFKRINNQFTFHSDTDPTPRYVKQYQLDPQYKLAVCARHERLADHPIKRDAAELCEEFIEKVTCVNCDTSSI